MRFTAAVAKFTHSRRFQKGAFIAAFIVSAAFIFSALSLKTDIYLLWPFSSTDPEMSNRYVPGAEMAVSIDGFNRTLLALAIIQFALIGSTFLFFSQSRRKYYPTNYVFPVAWIGFTAGSAIYSLVNVIKIRIDYLKVDFAVFREKANERSWPYSESTFFIDLNLVISILGLLACAAVAVVLVIKFRAWRKESKEKSAPTEQKSEKEGVTA